MTRAEIVAAIDGLFQGLEIVEEGLDEAFRVLSHPTLGPIGPELKSTMQGEAVREWFADGGDRAVIAYVVRQIYDEIKCAYCPINMEDDTTHLFGGCKGHIEANPDLVDPA